MPAKTKKAETETVKLSELVPDDKNANLGTERGRQMVEESLRRFGAGRSILIDKNGRIIAGNKTAEEAGAIGIDDVIIVKTDGKKLVAVQREDLDLEDAVARGLAFADNRTGEINLSWDADRLLADLPDMDLDFLGFDIADLEAPDSFGEYGEDIETEHKCPKCGYEWRWMNFGGWVAVKE